MRFWKTIKMAIAVMGLVFASVSHAAIITLGSDYYLNESTGLLVYSPTGIEAESYSVIDYQLGLEYTIQNSNEYTPNLYTSVATYTEVDDFFGKINNIADTDKTSDVFSSLNSIVGQTYGMDELQFGYDAECLDWEGGCGNIMIAINYGNSVEWFSTLDTYACTVNVQWGDTEPTTCDFLYVTDLNAVPVPAAVWLFGSGLIGLAGLARRKKA